MVEELNRTLCENIVPDSLVNSAYRTDVCAVTIASGQGVLKRGTALAVNADGKAVILGTENSTASYILCKDVDATSADITALAYKEGHFTKGKLIVKNEYSMTKEDIDNFRMRNIILSDEV